MKARLLARRGVRSRTGTLALVSVLGLARPCLADCTPGSSDLKAITTVIDDICNVLSALGAGGGGNCVTFTEDCPQVDNTLFAGVTFGTPGVMSPQPCATGGRGEIMGEAAICFLRDLSNLPSASPGGDGTGPGIHQESGQVDLGVIGKAEVKQTIGFLDFNPAPPQVMDGYQTVSICLPAFGCVADLTRNFTATLLADQSAHPSCADYPIDTAYGLDIKSADTDFDLDVNVPTISVDTPVGPVEATPKFDYRTHLKTILKPYGPPQLPGLCSNLPDSVSDTITLSSPGRQTCNGATTLDDIYPYTIQQGVTQTVMTPSGSMQPGGSWDSQLGMGGRDANDRDPNGLEANPGDDYWASTAMACMPRSLTQCACDADGSSPPIRPDLDLTMAREAFERSAGSLSTSPDSKPVGHVGASIEIDYSPTDLVPAALNSAPLSLTFKVFVKPQLETDFASQLNAYFADGVYTATQSEDCKVPPLSQQLTRLDLRSQLETFADFQLTAGLIFKVHLHIPLGFTSIDADLIDLEPTVTPIDEPGSSGDLKMSVPVAATATAGVTPPLAPDFDAFQTWPGSSSNGLTGKAFLDACLAQAPPPGPPPPPPSFTPGNPRDLLNGLEFPCNICLPSLDGANTPLCMVAQGSQTGAWCFFDSNQNMCVGVPPPPPGAQTPVQCVLHHLGDFPPAACEPQPGAPVGTDCSLDPTTNDCCIPNTTTNHCDTPAPACMIVPVTLPNSPGQLFPAPQTGTPWQCDAPTKSGCFDLCTWSPGAAQPITVVQSAVDAIGSRCNAPAAPQSCASDADCDDGNPCTVDTCPMGTCVHSAAADGTSCDDGLFCDGTDSCIGGDCVGHSGNPCATGGVGPCANTCDESSQSCTHPEGSACDDGDPCTVDDTCRQGMCTGNQVCHFECYETERRAFPARTVQLVDQFGATTATARRPDRLCNPADKNDEYPPAVSAPGHLVGYPETASGFHPMRNLKIVNQFGTIFVDAVQPERLMVPSAKSLTMVPPALVPPTIDHFNCYRIVSSRGDSRFTPIRGVKVVDQFGTRMVDLLRPVRLCAPADKNGENPGAEHDPTHLLCYRSKTSPRTFPAGPIFVTNQFEASHLQADRIDEFCEPSLKNPTTTTSTTTTTTSSTTTTTGMIQ